ncbi:MAG: phospholipase D family protein [Gemmatimonadales bacterium]|nr:phospholipase D family protein [Gemmatimonadales bacterium]
MPLALAKVARSLVILALLTACGEEPLSERAASPSPAADVDFCEGIHRDSTLRLSDQLRPVAAQMALRTGVYVLEEGAGSMIARAWLSEYAERSIDVQYFIFSADNVGLIAADYLLRAAERGVKVRMLVDDVLIDADGEELLSLDAHPNLEIRIYNPNLNIGKSLPGKLFSLATDFRGANQRMHNKTFTVDGQVVITGGRNIADEYFDFDHAYNFRDRDVLLLGGVVGDVQRSFDEFWADSLSRPVSELVARASTADAQVRAADLERFAWLHRYACDPANYWPQVRAQLEEIPRAFERIQASGALQWIDSVQYVTDAPGKNDGRSGLGGGGATTDALAALVRGARTTLDIQSPYLVTTEVGRSLLREAVQRGVRVRILTNSLASTDNLEAFNGYQRDREALLRDGVRIFEFRPDAAVRRTIMDGALQETLDYAPVFGLHAKSMVIDGEITVIGTFNMDPRSANLNTECVTVIHSARIAEGVLRGMEAEFAPENAWETTLASNPDGHAGWRKRVRAWTRGVVPKRIL